MGIVRLLQSVSGAAAAVLLLRFGFGYAWKRKQMPFWVSLGAAAAAQIGLLFLAGRSPEASALGQEALVLVCSIAFPYALLRHGRKRTFFLFGLRQYRTIQVCGLRSKIFRQVVQKDRRLADCQVKGFLCSMTKIDSSKACAANCAVLP